MGSLFIGIFTVALLVLCAFLVLIILMQRPSANAGMGAALGGGAMESAFGGQTGNVFSKATTWAATAFFILCFCLYLGHMYQADHAALKQQAESASLDALAADAQKALEAAEKEAATSKESLTMPLEGEGAPTDAGAQVEETAETAKESVESTEPAK